MDIAIAMGRQTHNVRLPDEQVIAVLEHNPVTGTNLSAAAEVERSLLAPIGSPRLKDIVKTGETVCIVTSDITRPLPSAVVLPAVLAELNRGGIRDEDILIVFALGIHRPHTSGEMKELVGEEVYNRIRCIDSDQKQIVHLGLTSRGTPVDLFAPVVAADRVVCLGNIEYHYFAGYSGGAKAIMPGVSTAAAIQNNHARMVEETAVAGRIEHNNVRSDIDEVSDFFKIDFIVNVVLDEHARVLKSFAGHHVAAHRAGCAFLDALNKVFIPDRAEVVLVSAGGFPKDINMYQAQKALDNSQHAVKPGGIIILAAECQEGLGNDIFARWMQEAATPSDLIARIRKNFVLGGHKAAAIALVRQKAQIFLVSKLPPQQIFFMQPFSDLQAAVDRALEQKGAAAKIIVMPYGGSTLPVMK